MGKGRDIVAVMVVFGIMVLSTEMVDAKVFPVGVGDGSCLQDICWTVNVTDWPKNKTIVAGDVLEFNYSFYVRNVVAVDEEGYNTCKPGKDARQYSTGHDHIQVPKGPSYFICPLNRLCQEGMKIAIFAK